jgi:hypothetical protein
MKPSENVYIGDGAYLEFTGYSFLFKAKEIREERHDEQ